jgi:hypothetical protein
VNGFGLRPLRKSIAEYSPPTLSVDAAMGVGPGSGANGFKQLRQACQVA